MKKLLFCLAIFSLTCGKNEARAQSPFFAKGADIGWLSEMEAAGIRFYDTAGKEDDCINIL